MSQETPHKIRVKASLAHLEKLVDFVISLARRHGVPEEKVADLHLAVDEACTNVIRYAYPPGRAGDLEVSCRPGAGRFTVAIQDWGKPFDPLSIPPPDLSLDLDRRPEGGLGIFFIRKSADELSYRCEEGSNLLVFAKRF